MPLLLSRQGCWHFLTHYFISEHIACFYYEPPRGLRVQINLIPDAIVTTHPAPNFAFFNLKLTTSLADLYATGCTQNQGHCLWSCSIYFCHRSARHEGHFE